VTKDDESQIKEKLRTIINHDEKNDSQLACAILMSALHNRKSDLKLPNIIGLKFVGFNVSFYLATITEEYLENVSINFASLPEDGFKIEKICNLSLVNNHGDILKYLLNIKNYISKKAEEIFNKIDETNLTQSNANDEMPELDEEYYDEDENYDEEFSQKPNEEPDRES
jgi:hypothetical protein